MIKRIAVATVSMLVIVVVIAPMFMYFYTLNTLDKMPSHSTVELSEEAVVEAWASNEICTVQDCSSITPYWMYRWLAFAVINDFIKPVAVEKLKGNVSRMASAIASEHISESEVRFKGMGWWHLTSLNLTIWLQRNWSAREIAEKYRETKAYQSHAAG